MKLTLSNSVCFFALFSLMLLAAACKKNNTDTVFEDQSELNVINASAGDVSISFFIDNKFIMGPDLPYTDVSGYVPVKSGSRKFDATIGGSNQILVSGTYNFKPSRYFSLFFAGTNAAPLLVFAEDDLFEPPAGKAKIRFVNLSPDSQPLTFAVKGGIAFFSGQIYKSVSSYINIDPSIYNFELRSGSSAKAEAINVPIAAGKIYTVWAGGNVADTGPTALSLQVMLNK